MSKIYVFDTSESGFHNTPSARKALEHCGAIKNQGFGIQNNSFGIPVMNRKNEPLTISKILLNVRKFINYARLHPEDNFKVENIGVDSIKYPKEYIAMLFTGYTSNIDFFDEEFKSLIPIPEIENRLLIYSGRKFSDIKLIYEITEKLTHFLDLKNIEFVPSTEGLAGRLMNGYCKKHNIPSKIFKTNWDKLDLPVTTPKTTNKGIINTTALYDKMSWSIAYCNNLLMFDDLQSKEISTFIKACEEVGYNSILYFSSTKNTQNKEQDQYMPSKTSI